MAQLTGSQKALLIAGFLCTGSINTLTKKFQFQTCSHSKHLDPSRAKGCPPGEKHYQKPWFQNLQMFMGEAAVISLFVRRRATQVRELHAGSPADAAPKVPFYIFLLPASCDVLGTGVGGVGMVYISASVWQMMRGSLIVFTSFLSMIFLGKKMYCFNWCAVLIAVCGLLMVGTSALLDEGNSSTNVPLGIFFTVLSQLFAAAQMVVEEKFVKTYKAPPEQVVGSEGLWGIMIMIIMLSVMYVLPGNDAGSYENALDSIYMLGGSGELLGFVLLYLVSISFFNFFGVSIAGRLSAVTRTINDALRTGIVWTVQLLLFYAGSTTYGQGLKDHSWMQLVGFLMLILGNLVNHKVLKIPCISYPDADAVPQGQLQAHLASPSARTQCNSSVASAGASAGMSLQPLAEQESSGQDAKASEKYRRMNGNGSV
eukprot:gnl/TRDRNA2_/TRDRNA2_39224_c1_seq1.p1 gnl/TRDRNA2_/TRDRNA2_39224_c1~~gnl/TRDRNA2_/TRDRNA2_39224_c1_seq1.p1  ORF type:complete len:427 (+),score=76.24 gnl/TRDRNA2_/TRDRNA2_39224_c1_seq1:44-1324(+)